MFSKVSGGSTLTRVPRYRPISKAELGKRGLIYGTGSRAKRPHRLTVLLAAQQNVCIRQAICNVQAPAAPSVPYPPRFRALALFGRRPPQRVDRPSLRRPKTCTKAGVPSTSAAGLVHGRCTPGSGRSTALQTNLGYGPQAASRAAKKFAASWPPGAMQPVPMRP